MKGHLHPQDEAAFEQLVEAMREQFARLDPGQWFEVRAGREQSGRITRNSVRIKPPEIHPIKG